MAKKSKPTKKAQDKKSPAERGEPFVVPTYGIANTDPMDMTDEVFSQWLKCLPTKRRPEWVEKRKSRKTVAVSEINIDQIMPGNNDRTFFDDKALQDLAASIKQNGLIQPITVRLVEVDGCDWYQIVAGERRFRAVKLLGWQFVPAIVKELTDNEASAIMLSENVSRADLDAIDEGNAYHYRVSVMGWTVAECAEKAGVSEVRVQFRLKLLSLREDIQQLVRSGNFQLGYAAILAEAKLDTNRQMLAFGNFRNNPKPTLGWFRNLVNEYATQQNQASMFEQDFLICQTAPASSFMRNDPPSPSTYTPDIKGSNAQDTIQKLIEFWELAAQEWDKLGKPFKKQECKAASSALLYAYSVI